MKGPSSYIHGVSTAPLIGKSIGDYLDAVAKKFAKNEALVSVFEAKRFTYAEFLALVDQCARGLMALGACRT